MSSERKAILHRMILPGHECPYGVRAKQMLEEAGYEIEEHILETGEEVNTFMDKHDLSTTPLIIIDGEKVGGAVELERYLTEGPA